MQYPAPGDNFPDYSPAEWDGGPTDMADQSGDSALAFNVYMESTRQTTVSFKFTSEDRDDLEGIRNNLSSPKRATPLRPPPPKKPIPDNPKAEKVQELVVERVRWLYREEKKWVPFIGYDSCKLEWRYQESQLILANTSKAGSAKEAEEQEKGGEGFVVLGEEEEEDEEGDGLGEEEQDEGFERVGVRGGLYEVDIIKRKCHAIYWTDDTVEVMRGTWFYSSSLEPVEEAMAGDIEKEHLEMFSKDNTPVPPLQQGKGAKKAMHELYFKDCHVDWYSQEAVYLYSNSTSSQIARSIGNAFGFSKASTSGYKLTRGYSVPAGLDDKPPPISHLVFVVHGVGYIMDKKAIIKNCSDLRKGAAKSIAKHFPDLISTTSTQRVEFLPVEWRSNLKLDNGMVSAVTPQKVKGIRYVLNSTGMDVLYYTSPLYRSEIVECVQSEVNNLYDMFRQRNEGFEVNGGRVSIFSHSLGSVIMYDIITGWNPIHLYDQYLSHEQGQHPDLSTVDPGQHDLASELHQARMRVSELEKQLLATNQIAAAIHRPKLNFKVENFFCAGSPLAVFLALRGVRPQGNGSISHIIPKAVCNRLFNIYFPSDPLAYRLEPLILRHYSTISPLQIHRYEGRQVSYHTIKTTALPHTLRSGGEEMKGLTEAGLVEVEQQLMVGGDRTSPGSSAASSPQHFSKAQSTGSLGGMRAWFSRSAEKTPELEALEDMERAILRMESLEENNEKMETDELDSVELEHRVDFELRESNLSSLYLSALTSHTSYWASTDLAVFVISQLFPDYLVL